MRGKPDDWGKDPDFSVVKTLSEDADEMPEWPAELMANPPKANLYAKDVIKATDLFLLLSSSAIICASFLIRNQ